MTPSEIATDDAQFALFAAEIRAARKRWGAEAVRELVAHYDSLDAEQEANDAERNRACKLRWANERDLDDPRRGLAAELNRLNRGIL